VAKPWISPVRILPRMSFTFFGRLGTAPIDWIIHPNWLLAPRQQLIDPVLLGDRLLSFCFFLLFALHCVGLDRLYAPGAHVQNICQDTTHLLLDALDRSSHIACIRRCGGGGVAVNVAPIQHLDASVNHVGIFGRHGDDDKMHVLVLALCSSLLAAVLQSKSG
jgi:hypothetical protein